MKNRHVLASDKHQVTASTTTQCPTVTSASYCSTCAVPRCLEISTISNPCGCPKEIPTTRPSFTCGAPNQCPARCGGTSYVYATPAEDCKPSTTSPSIITSTIKQCPTVISTVGKVCSTCVRPMCAVVSTISLDCGCPTSVPTIYRSFPCEGRCPGGCAATSYVYATETPVCSTFGGDCVPTVTSSVWPTKGCPHTCVTGAFCIIDSMFATMPIPKIEVDVNLRVCYSPMRLSKCEECLYADHHPAMPNFVPLHSMYHWVPFYHYRRVLKNVIPLSWYGYGSVASREIENE